MLKPLASGAAIAVLAYGLYEARNIWPTPTTHEKAEPIASAAPGDEAALQAPPTDAPPTSPGLAPARGDGYTAADHAAMRTLHSHFATGDFITALKLADVDASDPRYSAAFQAWLLEQMPAILTSAGWTKLKLGDCDEAITYLRRAGAMKRSVESAKGLAVCHYKQKDLVSARDEFAYYLEQPEGQADLQMQVLYTDVLESDGRYDEAVRLLEQLLNGTDQRPLDPELQEQLKNRLASMRARAKESGFQQNDSSRNFRIAYRAGDHEDLVAYVLQTLEDALDEYVDGYGFKPPLSPIEVLLYPAQDFRNLVVGGPEWAEGLFDGRLRIPVKQEILRTRSFDALRIVLRHELVHALLASMSDSRSVPSWFDEGLAQRLSCNPSCGRFQFNGSPGSFLAPSAFSTPYISFDAVKAGRAYQQSLYLIGVIEQRYGDDGLRRLVSGVTTSSALDSDGLLNPIGIDFTKLHGWGADSWGRRIDLGPGER